jgi:uncharacterized protein
MSQNDDRRSFIKKGLTTIAGIGVLSKAMTISQVEKLAATITTNTMPTRKLGKTEHNVSLLGLGGQGTLDDPNKPDESAEIINRAIDLGVNYLDTAATYGSQHGGFGHSERNIGEVMKNRRNEVFLATKTSNTWHSSAMADFEQSLKNLQTDYIDLYQLHNLRTHSGLDAFLQPVVGAANTFDNLKSQGLIGFTGVTGHLEPDILKRAIEEYDFDCILMTLNAADVHHLPFQYDLLDTAVKRNLGIIVMKVTSLGRIFDYGGIISMQQALRYVYSFPISTAIVGINNLRELEENVEITRHFERYTEQEMKEIERLTVPFSAHLNYYKTP